MLDLNSAEWAKLRHAYGSAVNIPERLRRLPGVPVRESAGEFWQELWSDLCHQGTVYTASYAAVPYFVADAASRAPEDRWMLISLVSDIEGGRHRKDAATLLVELETDYFTALNQMKPLIIECLSQKPGDRQNATLLSERQNAILLLGALATVDGFWDLGRDISML